MQSQGFRNALFRYNCLVELTNDVLAQRTSLQLNDYWEGISEHFTSIVGLAS